MNIRRLYGNWSSWGKKIRWQETAGRGRLGQELQEHVNSWATIYKMLTRVA